MKGYTTVWTRSALFLAVAAATFNVTAEEQQESSVQLSNVVVSAAGYEQNVIEASASVTIITAEDLQKQRFSSLAQALQNVEGIDVRGATGKTGGLNISIRGMPSEYTLILIDGRRQNISGDVAPNGFGEFATSMMPPLSAIQRIEVIRGPASTLYGSDAMGGVVNIITKPVSSEWGGSVTIDHTYQEERQYGDTSNINGMVSGPLVDGLLGIQVRGGFFNREESDLKPTGEYGSSTSLNTRGQNPVKGTNQNIGARLTLTPAEDHSIYVDVESWKQEYDNGTWNDRKLSNNDSNKNWRGYDDELIFTRDIVTLGHRSEFGFGRWESSLMQSVTETDGRTIPFAASYNLDTVTGRPVPGQASGIGNTNIGDERELKNTNIILDTKVVMPLGDHRVSIGGRYQDSQLKDGLLPGKTMSQSSVAVFIEDEWQLAEKLALTLGGRYENHETFGGHFSPRIYLVSNLTETVTVKGGVSQAYKVPSVNALQEGLNGIGGQGASGSIGNPDLKPELSTSYEVGAYWQGLNDITLSATVFHNEIEDKIVNSFRSIPNCEFATAPNRPDCLSLGAGMFPEQEYFSQSGNVDKAETQGLELSARIPLGAVADIAEKFAIIANYTYTDSKLESRDPTKKDTKLADTPEHMFNARLNWNATDNVSAWLAVEYRGESRRFDTHPDDLTGTNKNIYDAVGDLKAYEVLNLGSSWKISESLTLNASIYNLLNKDFRKFEEYDDNGTPAYASLYSHQSQSTKGTVQEGRRYWVSLTYAF